MTTAEDTTAQERSAQRKLNTSEIRTAQRKTAKPLLYIGIVSIVMLFAGLTSAYVVRADNGNWLVFHLPDISIVSTAIIITSSLTMLLAQRAIKKTTIYLPIWVCF